MTATCARGHARALHNLSGRKAGRTPGAAGEIPSPGGVAVSPRRPPPQPADQLPPHDERLERAVLGAVLGDAETARAFIEQLRTSDFYLLTHQRILGGLRAIAADGQAPDTILLCARLRADGIIDELGGEVTVASLPEACGSPLQFPVYLEELRALADRRELLRLATQAKELALTGNGDTSLAKLDFIATCRGIVERDTGNVRLSAAVQGPTGAFSFTLPEPDAPDELLRRRYLTRGSVMQISAQTGIGKSVLANQAAILWANGLPFLGFDPCRPLKVLVVQGENDRGENALINTGIASGCELTDEQRATADANCVFFRYAGGLDLAGLRRLLTALVQEHQADLLVLDPFHSFHVGKLTPEDLSAFYRHMLGVLAVELNVGVLVIHHWNKPPTQKPGARLKRQPDRAYDGSGAAEQANFCRAIVSVEATDDPAIFRLHYGKRGQLLLRRVHFMRQSGDPRRPFWAEVPDDQVNATNDSESIVGRILARITPGEKVRKASVKTWHEELNCTRDALRNAIEQALVSGDLHETLEKHGRTTITWLVRV